MRSDFALPKNFADQNDKGECYVTEASDSELWEDVITAEDCYFKSNLRKQLYEPIW